MKKKRQILVWLIPIVTTILSVFYIGLALTHERGLAMKFESSQIITSIIK